jgi:CelD/BcsL family acetyltransferase involved in cellulose biosynthesis
MAYFRTLDDLELSLPPLTTLDDATAAPEGPLSIEQGATLAGLAPQWEALASSVGAPPFLWPRWFAAWERAFAPGGIEPVAVRAGTQLVGVLPLLARGRGLNAAANDHTPRFEALASNHRVARFLADDLLARNRSLRLTCLDARSTLFSALEEGAADAGHTLTASPACLQPYIDLDGTWSDFEACLPRGTRREGARLRRRLAETGTVTFDYDDGGSRMQERLSEGFSIEGSEWKTARGTAITSSPATESFYRAIAEWAAERGWLRLAFLRVDGRPAAFDLCVEAHDTVYVLKGGFDPAFRKFGPGQLLIRETLIHAFDRGLRRYEFLGAADPYKLAWTETAHELMSMRSHPPTAGGRAQVLARRALAAARRAI